MQKAINLAKKGGNEVYPNPKVGSLIVKQGKVVAQGFYRKYGEWHAERIAINELSKSADQNVFKKKHTSPSFKQATLYCTLEPCCGTWRGKQQEPCTDIIIRSGIKKVVIGMLDPNIRVLAKGVQALQKAGIEVILLETLQRELMELNEVFIALQHQKAKKRPFVHAKIAQSLDAQIASVSGDSKWITGESSRELAHRTMRKQSQAIITGINTVIKDNPEFSLRSIKKNTVARLNPPLVIIDTKLQIPLHAKLFEVTRSHDPAVIIFCSKKYARPRKIKDLKDRGATVIVQDTDDNVSSRAGTESKRQLGIDLECMLHTLYKQSIFSILLESGTRLLSSFYTLGFIDKLSVFIAPKIIGGNQYPSLETIGARTMQEVLPLYAIKTQGITNPDKTKDVLVSAFTRKCYQNYV